MILKKDSRPRGIRNNNPLNIRESASGGDNWQGEHVADLDADFEEFQSPEYGIRAAVKIFENYRKNYGINTIADLISRWAPSSENNTQAYISSISNKLGLAPYSPLSQEHYPSLVKAMIYHENGQQPYDDETIYQGVGLGLA